MACKRVLDDAEIAFLLQSMLDDSDLLENVSESDDELMEDDVQSDVEDEIVDILKPDENIPPIHENPQELENLTTSSDSRIITVSQPTGRISSMNIVRTARGPARECKSLYNPISCFDIFFNTEIISEIVQWTNAEMSINRSEDMTTATFKDTNSEEIRALIGILTLSAALKNNHLSTDKLFNSTYSGTRFTATMSRDRFDFLIRRMSKMVCVKCGTPVFGEHKNLVCKSCI